MKVTRPFLDGYVTYDMDECESLSFGLIWRTLKWCFIMAVGLSACLAVIFGFFWIIDTILGI